MCGLKTKMSCSNKHIHDIEELYAKYDDQFKSITPQNIHKYTEVVTNLFQFYKKNRTEAKFLVMFDKQFSKAQKRNDIVIKKSFLVYIYQKLLKEGELDNEPEFWLLIQKSPSRNMSGVNSFAILLSPHPDGQDFSCKHNCYYCPDESKQNGADDDMPRSYLKNEPAVARGYQNNWDAVNQMMSRMNSLIMQGHEVDKLELIIEGGTYTEYPQAYLTKFHRDIFYSANTLFDTCPKRERLSLREEMYINITTKVRIIGICIETRPDAINGEWIRFFRQTGTTRIQLGVQHTDNNILKKINRGHTFEQAIQCVKCLKDNCFKVDIHLMPDLPGATPEKDKEMFDIVMKSNIIQPDQIKIYPCEVVPWTVIKRWFDAGKYKPYSQDDPDALVDVIQHAMINCKPWMRIPRIVRDIPTTYISGGNTCMNMRQVIDKKMSAQEKYSNDIRNREVGRHSGIRSQTKKYDIVTSYMSIRKYEGSGAQEYFISLESRDRKVIYGFLRLRIPPTPHNPVFAILKNMGLIRELHVYNNIVPVGKNKNISTQHVGIGKMLLKTGENIAWMHGLRGVAVISGEGVRGYYAKQRFHNVDTFMVKCFKKNIHILILLLNLYVYIIQKLPWNILKMVY